jgi:hypothetical protein
MSRRRAENPPINEPTPLTSGVGLSVPSGFQLGLHGERSKKPAAWAGGRCALAIYAGCFSPGGTGFRGLGYDVNPSP